QGLVWCKQDVDTVVRIPVPPAQPHGRRCDLISCVLCVGDVGTWFIDSLLVGNLRVTRGGEHGAWCPRECCPYGSSSGASQGYMAMLPCLPAGAACVAGCHGRAHGTNHLRPVVSG
ncbi:unnamed protein product, partial [Laminaria digitata]